MRSYAPPPTVPQYYILDRERSNHENKYVNLAALDGNVASRQFHPFVNLAQCSEMYPETNQFKLTFVTLKFVLFSAVYTRILSYNTYNSMRYH